MASILSQVQDGQERFIAAHILRFKEKEEGYIHRLHQWVNKLEKGDGQLRSLTSVNRQLSKEKIIKEQMEDPVVSKGCCKENLFAEFITFLLSFGGLSQVWA